MVDLTLIHPDLMIRMQRVLDAMAALGYPMRITEGLRTLTEQQTLYAQGRTLPGPIVTNANGIRTRSNHQAGHAVDCCFRGSEPFAETHPWKAYGACVEAVGLVWGGGTTHGWHGQDRPHAQLP